MKTLPGHHERLPAGHDLAQAEQLSSNQRSRILAAMSQLVAKRGYESTTIEQIVKRAGVSRATFYGFFENREACLLAGFADAVAELRERAVAACADTEEWEEQVRLGLVVFLEYVSEEPELARTCLIEAMTAGPKAMERYEQALQSAAPLLRQGRERTVDPELLPETLEDSLVGGVIWTVHQRILRGEPVGAAELLPTMVAFVLGPYLGEERAAKVGSGEI